MDPSLNYFSDPNRIQREIDAVQRKFTTFISKIYPPTHLSQAIVELTGMISTVHQKNLYMTPIRIVLTSTYPKSAPLCYLNPRASPTPMYIDRQCPNADCNTGLVRNVSYLINWQMTYDLQLPIVLDLLQRHFSDPNLPPLRAALVPPPQQQQVPVGQVSYTSTQQSLQQQQFQQRQPQQPQQPQQQSSIQSQVYPSSILGGRSNSGVPQFNPPGGIYPAGGPTTRFNGNGLQQQQYPSSASNGVALHREDSITEQFRKQVSLAMQEQMKLLTTRLAASLDSVLDEIDVLESRKVIFENVKHAQGVRLVELQTFHIEAEKRSNEARIWLEKWENKLFSGTRHHAGSDDVFNTSLSDSNHHTSGNGGGGGGSGSVETMVTATTILRNQLLECAAGDAAIEDCYRYIHDLEKNQINALASGTSTTPAEALCTEVRLLAVKQFKLRALKRKIQTALENEQKMLGEAL
jgi:hypothetical protein